MRTESSWTIVSDGGRENPSRVVSPETSSNNRPTTSLDGQQPALNTIKSDLDDFLDMTLPTTQVIGRPTTITTGASGTTERLNSLYKDSLKDMDTSLFDQTSPEVRRTPLRADAVPYDPRQLATGSPSYSMPLPSSGVNQPRYVYTDKQAKPDKARVFAKGYRDLDDLNTSPGKSRSPHVRSSSSSGLDFLDGQMSRRNTTRVTTHPICKT